MLSKADNQSEQALLLNFSKSKEGGP